MRMMIGGESSLWSDILQIEGKCPKGGEKMKANLVKKFWLSSVIFVAAFVADAEISFGDSYRFSKTVYFDGMEVELEKSCELQFYTSKDPYGYGINTIDSIAVEVFGAKTKSEINPMIESLSCNETLMLEVLSDEEFRKKVMPPVYTKYNWTEEKRWCSLNTPANISGMSDLEYRTVEWEYDEDLGDVCNDYDWPIELWPDHTSVEGRYWVVVTAKYVNKKQWYGRSHFRVWQKGTDIKSRMLYLIYDDDDAWPMAFDYKNSRHGFSFDVRKCGVLGLDHYEPGLAAYDVVFSRYWLEHDKGPQPINLPEAGTLYLENTYHGMIDDYIIIGADRTNFSKYDCWDVDENLFYRSGCYATTPGVWKIEVDSARTIKIAENDDVGDSDWNEIEFNRIQFFPKASKAVAVEAAFVSVNKYDYYPMVSGWWNIYLQGYVKGTGVYKVGETVSLEAVSAPDEEFSHWRLLYGKFPSGIATTNKKLSFKVTEDMAGTADERKQMVVQAVWKEKHQVTATVSDIMAGKATGSGFYHGGAKVTLKATPNKGYVFSHWEGPLDDTMDPRSPSLVYVVKTHEDTVVAHFVPAIDDPNPTPPDPDPNPDPDPTPPDPVPPTDKPTVSVVVVDGCEAMGKVSGGKTAKAGTKLTLKATANKGYVFSHWEGLLGDATDPRSPSVTYVAESHDVTFTAHFIPVADDAAAISFEMADEYAAGAAIAPVSIDVSGCTSLPKVTVKGLPSGLKFTTKDVYRKGSKTEVEYPANTIYGTPTKSGVYTVVATVTTAGKKTASASQTIIVRKPNEKVVVPVAVSEGGEVKGGGVYAVGKKVTLKAIAKKGFVFAGWYEDEGFAIPCDSTVTDCRNPSYAYTMGGSDKVFYARFEPAASDTVLDLMVDGLEVPETFTVSGYGQLALDVVSLSLPKISVKGLPAGMKFTAKPIYKKGSKTEVEIPANTIYGAPTKPGMYKVSVSISNTSVKKAIVKEFMIEAPDLAAPNNYFVEELDKTYVLFVGISNIDDFLPSLRLNSPTAKLAVSGLPTGLKYDAANGRITGIATKPGTYTVTLTVTDGKEKYVSTITVEVEALPDWVVGTFEGYSGNEYSDGSDWFAYAALVISDTGELTAKTFESDARWYSVSLKYMSLQAEGKYKYRLVMSDYDWSDGYIENFVYNIVPTEYDGVTVGHLELDGEFIGYEEWDGEYYSYIGCLRLIQKAWQIAQGTKLVPEFVKDTSMSVSMDGMRDDEWDPYYGGCLTFKFGSNGAVTTAYSERKGATATATGSAQLVPYDVDGDTVYAWLYTALKPKGRDPFGVLLFLEIDTSNGVVTGDDVEVVDYLLEVDE